jgi:3-hydroxyacyl-CoA dehydrogenase
MDDKISLMKRIEAASLEAVADCSIVIEAVFENAEVKSVLFKQIGVIVNKETMPASNTSSIWPNFF